MTWLRLNFFQRAMRLWERAHPYNAAHLLRIDGVCRIERLQAAIRGALVRAGVTQFVLPRSGDRYAFTGEPSADVRVWRAPGDPLATIRELLNEQMNEPFGNAPHAPFRWNVVCPPNDDDHWLALVYHHGVADATAIARLLADVLHRVGGGPHDDERAAAPRARLCTNAPAATRWLNSAIRRNGRIRTLFSLLALHRRMRSAHKMPDERGAGDRTNVVFSSVPTPFATRLHNAARARGAGLNDALLAALATALAAFTPDRHTSRRRRKLAVGSAFSARRWAPSDAANWFGVCLGDMVLLLDEPDEPFDRVLAAIARATGALKADPTAALALAALRVTLQQHVLPWLFIGSGRRNLRRIFPLSGGVSTFAVNTTDFAESMGRVTRYVRACPPGPAMPLVLAPTTFRGGLELSLVHRASCMSNERAAELLADVVRRLEQFVASSVEASVGAAQPPGGA
ncbi:MAG: hypothetical protein AB7Q17_14275 [Phycisphaerae bacterium]